MIDAAEICTRFSTIVTCWLQLISPVRDDETARVLARDECHGWLPLYNLRPRTPPPSSIAQRTGDRSSTCGGLVGMSASWGHASEFVDIPARFTLCPNLNLNCNAKILNFLTTKISQSCFWARFPLICICWKTWYFSLFWFLLIAPVTMRYKEISGQLLACKHGQFLSVNREEISLG